MRFLSVAVTLVLICAGIWAHSLITQRDNTDNDKTTFFKDDNYDVLFFGTSHVKRAISPFQLYKNFGITSYNFATNDQEHSLSYYALVYAVSLHEPKIIFLDVFRCRSNRPNDVTHGHYLFDNFNISTYKISAIVNLYDNITARKELIFPYFSYHNRWSSDSVQKNLNFLNLWNKDFLAYKNELKGYEPIFELVNENFSDWINMKRLSSDEYLDDENSYNIQYIKKAISFCNDKGIQIVLMYIPPTSGIWEQREANSIRKIAYTMNVPYYNMLANENQIIDCYTDFQNIRNINNVNSVEDFTPNNHLNFSGARKVTDYIGNILRTDFNAIDHRGDPEYAHWEDDYNNYRAYIFKRMRELSEFDVLLMACNFEDISVKLYAAENVSFDNVEQKLISQLGQHIAIVPQTKEELKSDVRLVITDDRTGCQIIEKSFIKKTGFH